jgi:hypothetical protein
VSHRYDPSVGRPDPPHFLCALGDGEHFGTGDGRLILRDNEAMSTVELHRRILMDVPVRAVHLGRCGEPYGRSWRALYLAVDRVEKVGPLRRRRVEAVIVDVADISYAVPLRVRLRLRASARRGEPLDQQLMAVGFRPLTHDTTAERWYRLDVSPAGSLLCRLAPDSGVRALMTLYCSANLVAWPPDPTGSPRFNPPCRLGDLTDYHKRTRGESTAKVPSELMPHVHFHVSDGGIVCAADETIGLISRPERPVDFGYGYSD